MKYLKILFLTLLSLLLIGLFTFAENWEDQILPIKPGSGIDTNIEMELDVAPMEISYGTVLKKEKSINFLLLLKNSTDKDLEVGNRSVKGYHESTRIFTRTSTLFYTPKIIEPGDYFITTFSYQTEGDKTISFIDRAKYSYNFSESKKSYTKNLQVTNISKSGWGILQVKLSNISEDKFIKSNKTSMQLLFFNKDGLIIGWKNFLGTSDTVVPGGERVTRSPINMGVKLSGNYSAENLIDKIHSGEVEVRVIGIPVLSDMGGKNEE